MHTIHRLCRVCIGENLPQVNIVRGNDGFGFTICSDCPVRVQAVDPGGPAHQAGLQQSDSVLQLNGVPVEHWKCVDLAHAIRNCQSEIVLVVWRGLPVMKPYFEGLIHQPSYKPPAYDGLYPTATAAGKKLLPHPSHSRPGRRRGQWSGVRSGLGALGSLWRDRKEERDEEEEEEPDYSPRATTTLKGTRVTSSNGDNYIILSPVNPGSQLLQPVYHDRNGTIGRLYQTHPSRGLQQQNSVLQQEPHASSSRRSFNSRTATMPPFPSSVTSSSSSSSSSSTQHQPGNYGNYQNCTIVQSHLPYSGYGAYVTLAPKTLIFPVFVQPLDLCSPDRTLLLSEEMVLHQGSLMPIKVTVLIYTDLLLLTREDEAGHCNVLQTPLYLFNLRLRDVPADLLRLYIIHWTERSESVLSLESYTVEQKRRVCQCLKDNITLQLGVARETADCQQLPLDDLHADFGVLALGQSDTPFRPSSAYSPYTCLSDPHRSSSPYSPGTSSPPPPFSSPPTYPSSPEHYVLSAPPARSLTPPKRSQTPPSLLPLLPPQRSTDTPVWKERERGGEEEEDRWKKKDRERGREEAEERRWLERELRREEERVWKEQGVRREEERVWKEQELRREEERVWKEQELRREEERVWKEQEARREEERQQGEGESASEASEPLLPRSFSSPLLPKPSPSPEEEETDDEEEEEGDDGVDQSSPYRPGGHPTLRRSLSEGSLLQEPRSPRFLSDSTIHRLTRPLTFDPDPAPCPPSPHTLRSQLTKEGGSVQQMFLLLTRRKDCEFGLVSEKRKKTKSLAEDMKSRLPFLRRRSNLMNTASLEKALRNHRPSQEEVLRWAENFDTLLLNKYGLAVFRHFLRSEFSEENLDFWLAVEKYRKTRPQNKMAARAEKIYNQFISTQACRQINVDSSVRELINQNLRRNHGPVSFQLAQDQIYSLMETDSYPRFLKSRFYTQLANQNTQHTQTANQNEQGSTAMYSQNGAGSTQLTNQKRPISMVDQS